MGDPRMVIRIAANVSELKRNLAEGKSQVEALSTSVEKIAKSFDGAKLIQQANNVTAAIDKIGGASKLTEAEQARVNATLEKAIQKYQALGKEAPAAMTALYNATKKVDDATTGAANGTGLLGGAVGKLAAGFAVGSLIDKAVTGIFNFGKEAFETAGMVVDLSKKTGLSTTAVQQFGFVASQGGSTLEKWADTIFKAGVNIETGGEKVRHGIAGLGLEYDRIKALKPEAQFDAIMRALANIESPQERNRLGVEALGKGYADVAASVDDYIDLIGKAPVASDAAIQATDAASDAIGRAWDQAKATAINAIGGILEAWESGKATAQQAGQQPGGQSGGGYWSTTLGMTPLGFAARMAAGAKAQHIDTPTLTLPKGIEQLPPVITSAVAALAEFGRENAASEAQIRKNIAAHEAWNTKIKNLADTLTGESLADEIRTLDQAVSRASVSGGISADQFWKLSKRLIEVEAAGGKLTPQLEGIAFAQRTLNQLAAEAAFRAKVHTDGAAGLSSALKGVATVTLSLPSALLAQEVAQNEVNLALADAFDWEEKIKAQKAVDRIKEEAVQFAQLQERVAAVGDVMAALARETDGTFSLMMDLGSQAAGIIGSIMAGDTVGAIVKSIQLIGQAIRALRPEGAKVNDLRDEFLAGAGGAEALYEQLQRIGRMDLWEPLMAGRGRLEDIEDAIGDVEGAIEALDEAMSRYGLSLDDAGTATERAQRATQRLTTDFESLRKAGFSVQQVTAGAASQLNSLIAAALEAGTKLPASLGPYVEELIRTGGLTDELKRKLLGVADPVPWQQMQADAEKYGIAIGALGKQFEQAKLDSIVAELSSAWTRFTDNGADATGVMEGMKDEVSELVRKALELGLTIPDSMKPLIEAMDKAGLLTDKNGEKLEGLGDLKWADPVVSEVDKLIAKMDELIDKILNGVVPALGDVTAPEIDGSRTSGRPGRRPNRAHSGALVLADGIRRYHAGSANVLPFPRMTRDEFPAILQTGEAVLNRRAVQAVGTDAIGALNTGQGAGAKTITFAPVVHVHPSPGMNERDLAMRTVEQIAKGAGLDKLKRAVNG